MYLQLFHGRTNPDQQMDDWGSAGPVIGPLNYVHTTYATNVQFGFADESKSAGWLTIIDGLIYYDGVFYGDWSTFAQELDEEHRARLIEFDQAKAKTPEIPQPPATSDTLADLLTAISSFAFAAQERVAEPTTTAVYLQHIIEASEQATKLYHQYHILRLHGGIEPEVIGPFPTEDERDATAQDLRRENDVDVILAMNGTGSSVNIFAYSAGFLDPQDTNERK